MADGLDGFLLMKTSWFTDNHNSAAKNGTTLPAFNGFGNVSMYPDELLGYDLLKWSRVCRWFNSDWYW